MAYIVRKVCGLGLIQWTHVVCILTIFVIWDTSKVEDYGVYVDYIVIKLGGLGQIHQFGGLKKVFTLTI